MEKRSRRTFTTEFKAETLALVRPLNIAQMYPTECAVQVANFYQGSNLLIGAKNRIVGLTLVASDAEWRHGEGPEVTGPIRSLVLAMTGRKAAIEDLSGRGAQTLELRCVRR